MANQDLLRVENLSAGTDEKEILHGVDLTLTKGTCDVLMGPNGAGKTTLGRVILGDPAFEVSNGGIVFDDEDVTRMQTYKRARAGMFLSFQSPAEVPGVPLYSFLRTVSQTRPELKMSAKQFRKHVTELADELELDTKYLTRDLGVGFSGGEKKKVEMLQLLLLQPKLAIMDETDSGLDVDALNVVSQGIAKYREACEGTLLIITHNTRILDKLDVDHVHVMVKGSLVENGNASLITQINQNGFERFEKAVQE